MFLDKVQEEFFKAKKKKNFHIIVGPEMSDFLNFTWKFTRYNKYHNCLTFYLQLI